MLWLKVSCAESHVEANGTTFIEKFFKVAEIYLKNRKIDIYWFLGQIFSFYAVKNPVMQKNFKIGLIWV